MSSVATNMGWTGADVCQKPPALGQQARVIDLIERSIREALRVPYPPPFDVLDPDVARVAVARWTRPCEALFDFLAAVHPVELVKLVKSDALEPHELTFAAEALGRLPASGRVRDTLLPLLEHPAAVVREGAIYGLARHLDEATRTALRRIADTDTSPGVRVAAKDVLVEP